MNKQLSFEEAKRLSIIKWTKIVELLENDNSINDWSITEILKQIPEISQLISNCGFCERYVINVSYNEGCAICEFGIKAEPCMDDFSLFSNYKESFGYRKLGFAKQILETIESLENIHNEI